MPSTQMYYMLKVNNRNALKRCEISSDLTIKTTEQRYGRRSGVLIVTLNILFALF